MDWLFEGIGDWLKQVLMGSAMTFCVGVVEVLASPMILSFSDSETLGTTMTIIASGILLTSLILGIVPIKKNYAAILSVSLFLLGLFIAGIGFRQEILFIRIFGFLMFAMLPLSNTCIDYLLRTNIANEVQGRAWGLIGILSQLGSVVAFALSGILADYIFTPMLLEDGQLAGIAVFAENFIFLLTLT